jgi:SAM-dependent methyltransferase
VTEERLFPATVMPDPQWWRALWPDPDGFVRALGMGPGMTVVDLCCGDGYFTAAIARQVGSGRVIGLDLDSAMLEQAKVACAGMANCEWLLGDAMELSRLVGKEVDAVLIANTFHGVPDKTALVRNSAAVLRPGGRFVVVNWHPLAREETPVLGQPRGPRTELRMPAEQTQRIGELAGLALEAIIELPPYHYGAIFRKVVLDSEQR